MYSQRDSLRLIYTDVKQTNSSRFKALKDQFLKYRFKEIDSALKAIKYHHQLAEEKNNKEEIFHALSKEAWLYGQMADYEKSIRNLSDALAISKELNMRDKEAMTIANRAVNFNYIGNHIEGIRDYNKALTIFRELKMDSEAAWILQNIGVVNLNIGNYDLALEYFQKYQNDYNKYNFPKKSLYALNKWLIGRTYLKKELSIDALIYFENALEQYKSLQSKYGIQMCLKYLPQISNQLNQLDKATNYAQKYLALSKELKFEWDALEAELILAEITFKTDVSSALNQAQDILGRLPKDLSYEVKERVYDLLYNGYKAQNNSKLAIEMLELSNVYQDSIALEIDRLAITRELVKQDYEHRLSESKLKSENEKVTIRASQHKITFAIVITSALIFFCIIFYSKSKTKNTKAIRNAMLHEIIRLKNSSNQAVTNSNTFELVRENIEQSINRKLNETDWKVLNVLLEDPVITNKEIAEKIFLSVDGIGSSLRRMYVYFNIKESKYKKVSLLRETIKQSNSPIAGVKSYKHK
ncbi:MAG: hypothetical protein ACJAVA_002085 [Flavobacteriaceae bacterium]